MATDFQSIAVQTRATTILKILIPGTSPIALM